MSIHLSLIRCSVSKGYTIWEDKNGKKWKFQYGAGAEMEKMTSVDPLVFRARYGLPSNFYYAHDGEMDISPELLRWIAEEISK